MAVATEVTRSGVLMFFFGIEVAHVSSGFACLNLLYDGVDRCFLQGRIAIGSVDGLFNFVITFPGPGKISNKKPSACHTALSEE